MALFLFPPDRRRPLIFFIWISSTLCASLAPDVLAQTISPTRPPRIIQDEPDQRGRSSISLGSGARALGMGGAFLARADDATAASWNPAGLSYLRHPELSLVGARNAYETRERNSGEDLVVEDQFLGYTPDFFAITYPVSLGSVSGAAQLSIQRVIAFEGERRITEFGSRDVVADLNGGFDVVALGSGFQLSRKIRAGLSLNHWRNGYDQTLTRFVRRGDITIRSKFGLSAWNVNGGLIWTPLESLNVGVAAKTPFTASMSLSRDRTDMPAEGATTNQYERSDLELDFPGTLGAGLSWRPLSPLTLSLDYTRTFWSQGRIRNYFTVPPSGTPELGVDLFPELLYPTLEDAGVPPNGGTASTQRDTEQVRGGVEYVLIKNQFRLPLRAGYFTDKQYFLAEHGAPRFNGFTAGVGVGRGPLLLDMAYVFEIGRFTATTGNRNTSKFRRVFLSLIYRHGSSP